MIQIVNNRVDRRELVRWHEDGHTKILSYLKPDHYLLCVLYDVDDGLWLLDGREAAITLRQRLSSSRRLYDLVRDDRKLLLPVELVVEAVVEELTGEEDDLSG